MKKNMVLITHWKTFHADDVVAGALLDYFLVDKLERYENCIIKRVDYNKYSGNELKTLVEDNTTECFVFDVGRSYEPENRLFDHHQYTKEEDGRASAGMVFDWLVNTKVIDSRLTKAMEPMIRMVDDNDIGVKPAAIGELSWIIRHLNPDYESSDKVFLDAYIDAANIVKKIIKSLDVANEELKNTITMFHKANKVLEDDKNYALEFNTFPKNWQDYIYNLDRAIAPDKELDIIIWYNAPDDTWQAQTINVSSDDYAKRGRKIVVDEDYISDIKNEIVFVHKGEFFMVGKSKDAVYKYLDKFLHGKEDTGAIQDPKIL